MKPETEGKIKFGGWGLAFGAVIAMIIGFGWGGWSTEATTKRILEEALLGSRSAICVAQFMNDPNHDEMQAAFEKVDSWKRYQFIEKGGWDKMPGQEQAGFGVARACSSGLETMMRKE